MVKAHLKDQYHQKVRAPHELERADDGLGPRDAVLLHAPSCDSQQSLNAVAQACCSGRRDGFDGAVVHATFV